MIAICDANTYRRLLDFICESPLLCSRYEGVRGLRGIKCCGVKIAWDSRLPHTFVTLSESQPRWSGTWEEMQIDIPTELTNEITSLATHLRTVNGADLMADFFEREANA